jgi:hypothetical protein
MVFGSTRAKTVIDVAFDAAMKDADMAAEYR